MKELKLENTEHYIKINGKQYTFEPDDTVVIESIEKFRTAMAQFEKESANATTATIKKFCNVCIGTVEDLFGKESVKDIFGDKANFDKCFKCALFILKEYSEYWENKRAEYKEITNAGV